MDLLEKVCTLANEFVSSKVCQLSNVAVCCYKTH